MNNLTKKNFYCKWEWDHICSYNDNLDALFREKEQFLTDFHDVHDSTRTFSPT